ncbi:60S ribosome subunit biogenesis protein NIP7 [Capsaspora owczarzaki ATCC 30864]|uniref:60S ribosome subunit biogenesis protein NIP7 homolog n=1 Tax=Capsaspora owczarzaki (strain ATCC 30864) TaxID=595528 RepID=A0A0D2X181_CAPO3|nr:60S ribosome subunit biogenesis protein NIP7 [Capsaspora owczarzaki ATCC 30864]KJE90349.1 60S ribosome subunit biogenesis protein NIP7 [Capsaspora owczarzaki ATCC 30864]|eukprot:XP_004364541.1 60S ribosome subunit biogenesis protein NIP7 [Capsaspora owczarzaki ATCC 30864]
MRPLTEDETKIFFEKLANYIGGNIQLLIDRPDGMYCFRLHRDRVYYVSEEIMRKATSVARDNLMSLGTCFGKFTKSGKFRLQVTALEFLAPYAKFKVWVKPNAEQSYLYGNHVLKSGLGRITEDTPRYQGVVVYSMNDIPLGFGVAAYSTQDCRKLDPTGYHCFPPSRCRRVSS